MALHVGLRYPRSLAGLLILSGYLVLADSVNEEASAGNKTTPIQFCHGSRDAVVPMNRARATFEELQHPDRDSRWLDYPIGHEVCDEEVMDIRIWLAEHLPAEQREGRE